MWTTEKYQFRDVMFLSSLLDLGEVAPTAGTVSSTGGGGKKSKQQQPGKPAIFLKDPMLGRVTIEFAVRRICCDEWWCCEQGLFRKPPHRVVGVTFLHLHTLTLYGTPRRTTVSDWHFRFCRKRQIVRAINFDSGI